MATHHLRGVERDIGRSVLRVFRAAAIGVLFLPMLVLQIPADAHRTCSDYDHRHYHGSVHFYNWHDVYQTNGSGTGEWTYWWDSQWNYYQWDYYHRYYGSLYCN